MQRFGKNSLERRPSKLIEFTVFLAAKVYFPLKEECFMNRIVLLFTLLSFLSSQMALADRVALPEPIAAPRFSSHDLRAATSELVRVAETALAAIDDQIARGQTQFEVTQERILETMGISKSEEEALLASNETFFRIKKRAVETALVKASFLRNGIVRALGEVRSLEHSQVQAQMPRALNRLLTFVIVAGSTLAGVVYLQPWVIATIPGVLAVGPIYVAGVIGFAGGCILGAIFQTVFQTE